jgi:hypothetical protein
VIHEFQIVRTFESSVLKSGRDTVLSPAQH